MPTDADVIKRQVKAWAEKKGLKEAQRALINQGLSYSIAYMITTGRYVSEPKDRVIRAVTKAMKN